MNTKRIIVAAMAAMVSVGAWSVPASPRVLQQLRDEGRLEELETMLARERVSNGHLPQLTLRQQSNWVTVEKMQHARETNANEASSVQAAKRSQAEDTPYEINQAPRGIVIMAAFSDLDFNEENSQEEIDKMLNDDNYTYDMSIGSARKYFQEQSGGLYNPYFDVVGPVKLPQTMSYYGQNNRRNEDQKCGQFVLDACAEAVKIEGVDFNLYDNNQDGVLDFVYIIYPGYSEAAGAPTQTMWPASWDMEAAVYNGDTELEGGENGDWKNQDKYTIGGKVIRTFAYSSELSGTRGTRRAGIGTFCHEFSHVIGLPDLYDTYYGSNYSNSKTPRRWHLLDSGTENEDGQVPPGYNVFDKWFVGWSEPTLLHESGQVELPADGQTYLYVTEDGLATNPASEKYVYYLENRQQESWDKGLPGHGLLIWRVRYDQNIWFYNEVNASRSASLRPYYNTENETLYTLVSAKGTEKGLGTAKDSYPGSMDVHEQVLVGKYQISNIEERDGVIYFDFIGDDKEEGIINVNANENENQIQKTIINGQLYIKRNEKTYTITGQHLD